MKAYIKSIWRLIKSNFSRFITVVLIVMLGVGFLVGLFSVVPDLQLTMSNYLRDSRTSEVYFRSSTGLLNSDKAYLMDLYKDEDIVDIRSTYEVDEYVKVNDSNKLAKIVYSDFSTQQDILSLVEGRMPETNSEVVVERSGNYLVAPSIGSKITTSNGEFTVVGIVASPYYIMKERYNSDVLQAALDVVCYADINNIYHDDYVNQEPVFTNFYAFFNLKSTNQFTATFKRNLDDLLTIAQNSELETLHNTNLRKVIEDEVSLNAIIEALQKVEEMSSPLLKIDVNITEAQIKERFYQDVEIINDGDITVDGLPFNAIKLSYDSFKEILQNGKAEGLLGVVFSEETIAQINQAIDDTYNEQVASSEFYYLDRFDILSFVYYDMYVEKVSDISLIFPVFFFIITSLVTLTSLRRLIHEERNTIGTLRGLGYSNLSVCMRYMVYGILASGLGSLLGIALGVALIPKVIYEAYLTTCFLPPLIYAYNALFITLCVFGMILLIMMVIFLTVYKSLKETPASLLIPKAPPVGRRIFLEKIGFIWKHLSFKYKSTIRNMIRYKRNLIMMLIGVGGCAALVLVAFGLQDSINAIGKRQYEKIVEYDAMVKVNDVSITVSDADILSQIPIYYDEFSLDDYNIKVIGANEDLNGYINFYTTKRHSYSFNNDMVAVSMQIAKEFDLKVGSTISYLDNNLTITNIFENYVDNYLIIGTNVLDFGVNTYLLKTSDLDFAQEGELANRLSEIEGVIGVSFVSSVSSAYVTLVDNMHLIVVVVVLFAAILALVVIFNLMNINISERQREIATLKVLGYSTAEVHGYIARETFILTLLGIGLGIGVGYGLHQFIALVIDTNGLMTGRILSPLSYVWSVFMTLGFAVIVDLCFIPKYKKISMTESLKAIE